MNIVHGSYIVMASGNRYNTAVNAKLGIDDRGEIFLPEPQDSVTDIRNRRYSLKFNGISVNGIAEISGLLGKRCFTP